jgi:hypothetical protein
MAISEDQLETWSNQGPTGQFTASYNAIRDRLLDNKAPYPSSNVEVYLQGSYRNHTNVHCDSDVDIVLCQTGAFFYDIDELTEGEKAAFKADYPTNAAYGYKEFKKDAEDYIRSLFAGVTDGGKALKIPAGGNRRDADIIICQSVRRYVSYGPAPGTKHEGIAFFVNGNRIDNFPKQHAENCTSKHQATEQRFKRMVRVFKNMRNSLIDNGHLANDVAPSYFIEGMLFNVPNDQFVGSYQDMWVNCFNWLVDADPNQLTTSSQLHWLIRDDEPVCWPSKNFHAFLAALRETWES